MPCQSVAGSYRDPSGHVLLREGRVFRAIDASCHSTLRELAERRILAKLIDERRLVPTAFVDEPSLRGVLQDENPGFDFFLEHEVLRTIAYPYEWTVSMLADAGIHTLDLQIELLAAGCSLKDATAYNVQFVHGRPVFIDVSSIERPTRLDVWFALGQFYQMFLFPLFLCVDCGWDLRSYFLASLQGRQIEEVARSFGWLTRFRPRLLADLTIPLMLHRWVEKGNRANREVLSENRPNADAQLFNLRRLRKKLVKLADRYRTRSIWSEYTGICNYKDEAEQAKESLVRDFVQAAKPRRVLDLGCNTGQYSRLAAACGADVWAADADHDAMEILYRQLREAPTTITPFVLDICSPSPGLGYMNRERAAFLDRVDADCVFAMALMHHLLVSGNLPLPAIRDLLYRLTNRDVVFEFIPPDDNMFERLMKFRRSLFGDLTLDGCRRTFQERFQLLREEPIPDSKRTLLFLRKAA